MSTMVPMYGFGGGGNGSGGKIVVTAPAGATVTVSKDGKVKTKVAGEDGLAVFKGLDNGTWRVSLLNEDGSESFWRNIAVTLDYSAVVDFFNGYLYNAGDECEKFTGGWTGDDSGALYKGTSNMILRNNSTTSTVYAFTRIPFDTTGYSTITFKARIPHSATKADFGIACDDKAIVSKRGIINHTVSEASLDISGHQGKFYLFFSCSLYSTEQGSGAVTVYSVKIE